MIPREVEMVLTNGKCQPVGNPFHIYFRWGQALVEIKPYGATKEGLVSKAPVHYYPEPKFFRRRSGSQKRYDNRMLRKLQILLQTKIT